LAVESGTSIQFQLEQQIKDEENQLKLLEDELNPLEESLNSDESDSSKAIDDFNKLEEPAKRLLIAAYANDIYFHLFFGGGYLIEAGEFCVDDKESLPVYKKAITHLVNKGLIEELTDRNYKRYKITIKGYELCEHQKSKEHSVSETKKDTTSREKVSVFISYSHVDEKLKDRLILFLTPLKRENIIEVWTDRDILAGDRWDESIKTQLEESDLILLLVSPDFIASEYCYNYEMQRAIERSKAGIARVIPILLRPTDWQS
jgi:hypothetical protein